MTVTRTKYPQVFDYLLCSYGTDENIADTEIETTLFSNPWNETLSQHAEALVRKHSDVETCTRTSTVPRQFFEHTTVLF